MLIAALLLNMLILGPVVLGLLGGSIDGSFGPDTDARRILVCVYAAIALVSAVLVGLHLIGHPWAVPMSFALFAVQITYKLGTALAIGLSSPVVLTNLLVVLVQIAAITSWSVARG